MKYKIYSATQIKNHFYFIMKNELVGIVYDEYNMTVSRTSHIEQLINRIKFSGFDRFVSITTFRRLIETGQAKLEFEFDDLKELDNIRETNPELFV